MQNYVFFQVTPFTDHLIKLQQVAINSQFVDLNFTIQLVTHYINNNLLLTSHSVHLSGIYLCSTLNDKKGKTSGFYMFTNKF